VVGSKGSSFRIYQKINIDGHIVGVPPPIRGRGILIIFHLVMHLNGAALEGQLKFTLNNTISTIVQIPNGGRKEAVTEKLSLNGQQRISRFET
jgi:hypothetical protein